MAPPSYSEVAAASVVLNDRAGQPGYSGTMFPVSDLMEICPDCGTEIRDGVHL
jgi:hypothetical protein